jgi:thiamine monophosphate kinase
MRINLQAESIPLAEELLEYALPQGIPAEAALVGGAGEYELLFGTPRDLPGPARAELEAMNITAIADYCSDAAPGIVIHTKKSIRAMTHPPPCPRATASLAEYVNAVVRFAAAVFGGCT